MPTPDTLAKRTSDTRSVYYSMTARMVRQFQQTVTRGSLNTVARDSWFVLVFTNHESRLFNVAQFDLDASHGE